MVVSRRVISKSKPYDLLPGLGIGTRLSIAADTNMAVQQAENRSAVGPAKPARNVVGKMSAM